MKAGSAQSVFRCGLKTFSDANERVLCDVLFHTNVAEATKVRLPIVSWQMCIVDDHRSRWALGTTNSLEAR